MQVLQGCYAMLRECAELSSMLTAADRLAICVAAVGHDIGHTGTSNAFLVNAKDPLALQVIMPLPSHLPADLGGAMRSSQWCDPLLSPWRSSTTTSRYWRITTARRSSEYCRCFCPSLWVLLTLPLGAPDPPFGCFYPAVWALLPLP